MIYQTIVGTVLFFGLISGVNANTYSWQDAINDLSPKAAITKDALVKQTASFNCETLKNKLFSEDLQQSDIYKTMTTYMEEKSNILSKIKGIPDADKKEYYRAQNKLFDIEEDLSIMGSNFEELFIYLFTKKTCPQFIEIDLDNKTITTILNTPQNSSVSSPKSTPIVNNEPLDRPIYLSNMSYPAEITFDQMNNLDTNGLRFTATGGWDGKSYCLVRKTIETFKLSPNSPVSDREGQCKLFLKDFKPYNFGPYFKNQKLTNDYTDHKSLNMLEIQFYLTEESVLSKPMSNILSIKISHSKGEMTPSTAKNENMQESKNTINDSEATTISTPLPQKTVIQSDERINSPTSTTASKSQGTIEPIKKNLTSVQTGPMSLQLYFVACIIATFTILIWKKQQ